MFTPASTYRIQFNKDFTFNDLLKNKDYFFRLHPAAVYASPVLEAAPGSTHGYDVTNPARINPETGTMSEYIRLNSELQSNGIGWIQDIVPNHMGFHSNNSRLMDVLEKGEASDYATFFDIDFSHPGLEDKVIIPFLGKPLQQCLKDHEIIMEWFNGNYRFRYFDFTFPFSFESFRKLMLTKKQVMPEDLAALLKQYNIEDEVHPGFVNNEWNELKSKAAGFYEKSSSFRKYIGDTADSVNSDTRMAEILLEEQHYRLAYWRESGSTMNYRRFFTVNGLICINIDKDEVFDEYHSFIKQELKNNRIHGLRVDHIDGLKKPGYYLEKLRLIAGDDVYIVIEKILQADEKLPPVFPVQGTSGYDYLAVVNNLFTKKSNYRKLKQFYREFTGIKEDLAEIIYNKKKSILTESMNGELENLTRMFDEAGFVTYGANLTREMMKEAIGEFLVLFPVYRLYSESFPLSQDEAELIVNVFTAARQKFTYLHKAFDTIEKLFIEYDYTAEEHGNKAVAYWLRCLQFTGPLMAKGVEDTVMYYYNCFIAHNEVGDNPGSEGITANDYHILMTEKRRYWPLSMNATSTHDTKRGEDVRSRLNVISEIPEEWIRSVLEWQKINASEKKASVKKNAPDANEEYFIYQTIAGTFPMDGNTTDDYVKRLSEYLVKALREAKTNSNWLDPDTDYEKSVTGFIASILSEGSRFMKSFLPIQKKLAAYGVLNSLSQLMLKATSPGIPDFYQGTELWDLSMVDPDNRRPVNYEARFSMLKEIDDVKLKDPENFVGALKGDLSDGRFKLWMTWELLRERENDPDLFLYGDYIPLEITGRYKDNVIGYARRRGSRWFIVIVPLYLASADKDQRFAKIREFDWKDTSVILPEIAPDSWTVFNVTKVRVTGKISLSAVMKFPCPVFLKSGNDQSRFAGVLSHISSLPGEYGTGDLGEPAYRFADILNRNGQSFWQILPFNPVGEGYAFSPYSSISAFAGNVMFLSPELLASSGYIHDGSLNKIVFEERNRTDFARSFSSRRMLSDDAFEDFFCRNRPLHHARFEKFCDREKYWLDDFALFTVLKQESNDLPWQEWPAKLRDRDAASLGEMIQKYGSEIKKTKFMQFLFQEQWVALKEYCNSLGIRLIGDMSFYVNYDSVEVWAHPEYFRLDRRKIPVKVAGVPPDYFSSTGQLWNMPVYSWSRMKRDGYQWWLERIRRNLGMSDIVRFDHFRAFSEYWEVPYGETTAENGEWVTGPGYDFFKKVKSQFPSMPFIAEDLGTIDAKVYSLRDAFGLPGMVVLQFAFGDDVSRSGYAPHNHTRNSIVYTGTHDNNTTRGWFEKDLSDKNKLDLTEYLGYPVSGETCNEDFIRMAYRSVAKIAIIPVQDLLGLDETSRLNLPSTSENNWDWKMKKEDLEKLFSERIRRMLKLYGRI